MTEEVMKENYEEREKDESVIKRDRERVRNWKEKK